jgi:hypothetical protein
MLESLSKRFTLSNFIFVRHPYCESKKPRLSSKAGFRRSLKALA